MKKKSKIKKIIIGTTCFLILLNQIELVKDNSYVVLKHNIELDEDHDLNVVAHRGFSSKYQDNSLISILEALECPCVDMIEIDIQLTKDKHFVLSHDSKAIYKGNIKNINRINLQDLKTFGSINSIEVDFNFIKNLITQKSSIERRRILTKLFSKEEIITLEELIKEYDFSKKLIIDIKFTLTEENMDLLNEILYPYRENIILQSSNYLTLNNMKNKYPYYTYSYIINSKNDIKNMDLFDNYTIEYKYLKNITINPNKNYYVWLVDYSNFEEILVRFKDLKNVYFITDNPDVICAEYQYRKELKI